MATRSRAISSCIRNPALRGVEFTFLLFSAAEQAAWIGILVYAYQIGGVVEASLVGGIQLLPAILIAPGVALAGDHWRRDLVVAGSFLVQALSMGLTAAAMLGGAPSLVVYLASALICVALASTRPAVAALLPKVARDPEDLSAANAVTGVFDNCGSLVGPLLAAAALSVGGPPAVFSVLSLLMGVAAIGLLVAVRQVELSGGTAAVEPGSLVSRLLGGVDFLRHDRDALALVACVASPAIALGALDVIVVAATTELLGQAEYVSGYLLAAFGFGGLLGAGAAVTLIGSRQLVLPYRCAALLMGLPLVLMAGVAVLPVALVLLFLSGVGESLAAVTGMTLIQRTTPDRVRARVFGLFEGLYIAGLAIGALSVAAVYTTLGLEGTLIAVGLLLPTALIAAQRPLLRVDAGAHPSLSLVLGSLRTDAILAPLSPSARERLGRRASLVAVNRGDFVIREGEAADRYYVLVEGKLEVRIGDRVIRALGPGSSVGEIALLRSVPRTASVVAKTNVQLLAVDGPDFLEAVREANGEDAEALGPTPAQGGYHLGPSPPRAGSCTREGRRLHVPASG